MRPAMGPSWLLQFIVMRIKYHEALRILRFPRQQENSGAWANSRQILEVLMHG